MAKYVDIRLDAEKLVKRMREFARETGIALRDVYRDQMRLASGSLAKHYPPASIGQGRMSILKDLNNIFIEAPSEFILASWDNLAGTDPGYVVKTASGAVLGVDRLMVNVTGDNAVSWTHHQRNRLPKSGRVTRAGAFTRDIGRWKFITRMALGKDGVRRYAKKSVWPRVGYLKSGWMLPPGAGIDTKAPAWVRKARETLGVSSQYRDRMTPSAEGFLALINRVQYAGKHMNLVRIELEKRARDLARFARLRLDKQTQAWNRRAGK